MSKNYKIPVIGAGKRGDHILRFKNSDEGAFENSGRHHIGSVSKFDWMAKAGSLASRFYNKISTLPKKREKEDLPRWVLMPSENRIEVKDVSFEFLTVLAICGWVALIISWGYWLYLITRVS